ncbi:YbaK/EbsC family protein [Streptomyces sp. NBC_01089]|uniref:YbaK/EbsC family protein n=1 Tax=Streptomyces sp. NBC_01089 TaxID=2903747 RepID=UPI00386E35D7|nr:YbaK/EbsC family protein [Streptomyces sp. NBC_01089]WSU46424.1 YbaK/EbsC family protein [Streptomyces sp. NBC_01089]
MSLSKRARQFQDLLDQRGLDLTVVELPESTHTADDAARALGCEKAQIVKSLVFRGVATGEAVLVLASGPNQVNEKTVAAAVGGDIAKADADFVKTVTGYSIGGVPPLGHKEDLTVFVDEDLLAFAETWAAAGNPRAVFRIPMKITDILPAHTVLSVT